MLEQIKSWRSNLDLWDKLFEYNEGSILLAVIHELDAAIDIFLQILKELLLLRRNFKIDCLGLRHRL